jgi:Tol biopolymer transport system component
LVERRLLCAILLFSVPIAARAGTVSAISTGPGATNQGAIAYFAGSPVSNDGRFVTFQSPAADLVTGAVDGNGASDVFLRDRLSATTSLVSHAVGMPGTTANGASYNALISPDGSAVIFFSDATNLVPGQVTNGLINLFHWDRRTGAVTLVDRSASSPTTTGNAGLLGASSCVASGDGRWLAFSSPASDHAAGQTDGNMDLDVFLFDQVTGTTTLVSHAAGSPAQAGDAFSIDPAISTDGRWIAFASGASDLVPAQVGAGGVFLFDRTTGALTRVSPQGQSVEISGDGNWVVFESSATNLVPGQVDPNGSARDVFLWSRASDTTTLVSRSASSPTTTGNGASTSGTDSDMAHIVSADGRRVVFSSAATDLVAGQSDANGGNDIFLFDRISGTTTLVSHRDDSASTTANDIGKEPAISADGSRVAFLGRATDLVASQVDSNNDYDVFLFDAAAGSTALATHTPLSQNTAAAAAGFSFAVPRISADGRVVVFDSFANNLVDNDMDGTYGAFAHEDPAPGRDFFTAEPCRILDTRQSGPALAANEKRIIAISGSCGIPSTARSVVLNVTAFQPGGNGHLTLYPGDLADPLTSTLNFRTGETRANNAILPLALDGSGTLAVSAAVSGGGTVHLIVDVGGWFE